MIVIYGHRFYGRIKECGRSFIATQFVHIYYVPLIPTGTKMILEETSDGSFRTVDMPFSFKSMLAGYLRVWGPIAFLAVLATFLGNVHDAVDDPLTLIVFTAFCGVVGLAFLGGTILSYTTLGKLSLDEKRKRSVYSLQTGYFVDPGDMGNARHTLRESLLGTIRERSRHLASMGYRMSADISYVWPQVALDPTHSDDVLVTAAFTLARLDGSMANGAQKLQLEQIQNQLWQRILQARPPYLDAALQAA